ncbi:MAG: hypothetical protein ACD_28C00035G0002 [uncultured bacterium]|nr:MAG: hypothetical protein ACD_28C00035G0002 [uncultured bacterium]KKT75751.1 MAG: hypothetical protein UW70_C0029G0007 [Candidatus Peregrinibacteria bacterium GW2011_GWA2_44_7]
MRSEPLSMEQYIELSAQEAGWKNPVLAEKYTGQSLPTLKEMARRTGALDQTAGDIGDVKQPLNPDFFAFREGLREEHAEFKRSEGDAHDFDSGYRPEFPQETIAKLASYGFTKPVDMVHSTSGRAAIFELFYGLESLTEEGKIPVGILDPVAWSGLRDSATKTRIQPLFAPTKEGHGFTLTEDGLLESLNFLKAHPQYQPSFAYTIVPSNPTGEKAKYDELVKIAETAAANGLTLVIDIIYLAISPTEGPAHDNPQLRGLIHYLETHLSPEAWQSIVFVEGETKIVGTPRTGGLIIPKGGARNATLAAAARDVKQVINTYPDPMSALNATALHRFPEGIQGAMGRRYEGLEGSRRSFKNRIGKLIPIVGGNSFYFLGALVDGEGKPLIRDEQGRPVQDPKRASEILLQNHNLAAAPGDMFRPGQHSTYRFSAATTPNVIQRLGDIIEGLVEEAERKG